jgi:hypothetical protein
MTKAATISGKVIRAMGAVISILPAVMVPNGAQVFEIVIETACMVARERWTPLGNVSTSGPLLCRGDYDGVYAFKAVFKALVLLFLKRKYRANFLLSCRRIAFKCWRSFHL